MSYRLITKATLAITNAAGVESPPRVVEVRAYPSPKRDAAGMLTVDGAQVSYKRTGGKGRGTADRRYAYFPMGTESAYIEITEAEATAFVGGQVALTKVVAAADAPVLTVPADHGEVNGAVAPEAPVAAPKAPRRVKGAAKTEPAPF